jgi:hypothetical protein
VRTVLERLEQDIRFRQLVLVGVAGVVLSPYLVAGPGLYLDDWFAIRNVRLDSWWNAAGPDQWRARPGAGAIYAGAFGLVGARPLVHALCAAAAIVTTALLVEMVLRRFYPPWLALGVPLLWLLTPNHTSLETWPSALNIAVGLMLLLAGIERITRSIATVGADLTSAALLSLAVLCYEATAPAAVAAVVAAAVVGGRDQVRIVRLFVAHGVAIGGAGAWMLWNWHPAKTGIEENLNLGRVLSSHFGSGVVGVNPLAALLGGTVTGVVAIAVYKSIRNRDVGPAASLIFVGLVCLFLGVIPFLRYYYSPVGLGDRVTVVSGLGSAAVITGMSSWLWQYFRRSTVAIFVAIIVLAAAGTRASLIRDYSVAADDSRRIVSAIESRWPVPPDHRIVFGPYPVMKRNIVAIIDADWMVHSIYRSDEVDAGYTLTEEAFERFPPRERLNIVDLSRLEAVDRLTP